MIYFNLIDIFITFNGDNEDESFIDIPAHSLDEPIVGEDYMDTIIIIAGEPLSNIGLGAFEGLIA